jgi:hypothetical protein
MGVVLAGEVLSHFAGEVLSLLVVLRVWSHMMEQWLLPVLTENDDECLLRQ